MENLKLLVEGYLKSDGFRISSEKSGRPGANEESSCLVADKLMFGGERDTRLYWIAPPVTASGKLPGGYEHMLQNNILATRSKYPAEAQAFVIASSREGFSRNLQQELSRSRVKLRVPSQFFDTPFKSEETPRVTSAIKDIRSRANSQKRIEQPFDPPEAMSGEIAEDIFVQLRKELKVKPTAPTVRIIVGRAGIGKSFLFDSLFKDLYEDFLSKKNKQQIWPRPIPLLPEYLKGSTHLRTETLIDNFIRTDVASPVGRKTFDWLLVNGFATLLLDGLDELYAGDAEFFEDFLAELITAPSTKAQITIWCRDSVLTTSDAFAEFQEICGNDPDILKIYRLSEWERPHKKKFAKENIELRNSAEEFLAVLDGNETIKSLSGLPFYCELLLKQFQSGSSLNFTDDIELLNKVIDQMVDREIKEKRLLDMRSFEEDGLNEWMESIARDYIENGYSGINSEHAKEYGELVLDPDLDTETMQSTVMGLLQFPLFREGKETGLIGFAHELIAEALAARAYLRSLQSSQTKIYETCDLLAQYIDLENPMLLRFIAKGLSDEAIKLLRKEIQEKKLEGRGFAVALSLLLLADPRKDLLKNIDATLENRNLVSVRFEDRDLSNISFCSSDLSHASFVNCNLQNADFRGSLFNRTKFEKKNDLTRAQIDLNRVQSIIAPKYEDNMEKIRDWFSTATGTAESPDEPCPTALSIEHLFLKYIHPNGSARRDKLKYIALKKGKRFDGSAPIEDCIETAAQHSYRYLQRPDDRERYRRAEGDKYAEMVAFVQHGTISDSIARLIAELCPRRGCRHQLH